MFTYNHQLIVRYSDTDPMGYHVCNANYGNYFEQARIEALRSLGINAKTLEAEGITMRIAQMNINFNQPAYCDEKLTIKTNVPELPQRYLLFKFEAYNEKEQLISKSETR